MTPLLLLGVTGLLAMVGAPHLERARWVLRAPRLALLAWYSLIAAVLMATGLTAITAAVHWDRTHAIMCTAWRVCLDALRGSHGIPGQVVAVSAVCVLAMAAVRLLVGAAQVVRARRSERDRHATLMYLTGRVAPTLGATIVSAAEPAAYVVPGAAPAVVITTAAMAYLDPREIRAVLAHEHAHADGGHDRICDGALLLRRAFPRIAVFRSAHRQIARLVELCADDIALRNHSRLVLARALVKMAPGGATSGATLRADGGDAMERLLRLLEPPPPLPPIVNVLAVAGFALLPAVPVAVALIGRFAGIVPVL